MWCVHFACHVYVRCIQKLCFRYSFAGVDFDTEIRASNGQPFKALEIFSLALRFFKNHALQEVSEQSATRILNEDVRWVITVPASGKPGQTVHEGGGLSGTTNTIFRYSDFVLLALCMFIVPLDSTFLTTYLSLSSLIYRVSPHSSLPFLEITYFVLMRRYTFSLKQNFFISSFSVFIDFILLILICFDLSFIYFVLFLISFHSHIFHSFQAGIASPENPDQLLIALEPEAASIFVRRQRLRQLLPETPEERMANDGKLGGNRVTPGHRDLTPSLSSSTASHIREREVSKDVGLHKFAVATQRCNLMLYL